MNTLEALPNEDIKSTREFTPIETAITHLAEKIEDENFKTELEQIRERVTTLIDDHDNEKEEQAAEIGTDFRRAISTYIKSNPTYIKGTSQQALITGTIAFFIGFFPLTEVSSSITQTSLDASSKNWMIALNNIMVCWSRLQLSNEVNKDGGCKATRQLLFASSLALTADLILSNITDYRAITLGLSSFFSGLGLGSFSHVSSVNNWHEKPGFSSAIFGGVGGIAPPINTQTYFSKYSPLLVPVPHSYLSLSF